MPVLGFSFRRRFLVLFSAVVGVPVVASGQTWTGASPNNFMTVNNNWSPLLVPGATASVTFPNLLNVNQRYNIVLGAAFTLGSMTFTSTNAYTFSSTDLLILGNGTSNINSLNVTGSGGVTFNNPVSHITNTTFAATGSNITFAGAFSAGINVQLTLNPAASQTISFTGGMTVSGNSSISAVGPGTVLISPSSGSVGSTSAFRIRAGTVVVQNAGVVFNPDIINGTLRANTPDRVRGVVTMSQGSVFDAVASQSTIGAINISAGEVIGSPGSTVTVGGVRVLDSTLTPSISVALSTPFFTGNPGDRANLIDLDVNGNLVAASTSYFTLDPLLLSGPRVRFQPGSAGSTTTTATILSAVAWTLDGGRPVGPGGTVSVLSNLNIRATGAPRTLNANVSLGSIESFGFLSLVAPASSLSVASVSVGPNGTVAVAANVTINTLTSSGRVFLDEASTLGTALNTGIISVANIAGGSNVGSLDNFPGGIVSLFNVTPISGTITNSGSLKVAAFAGQLAGVYIHRAGGQIASTVNGVPLLFTISSANPAHGFQFPADFTLTAGANLVTRGQAGFTNAATFTLAGGTLTFQNTSFNAPHVNQGTLTGFGTIDSLNNNTLTFFFNDGLIKPAGVIDFTDAMVLINRLGTVEITAGNKLGLESGESSFTNRSLVLLSGGTLGNANTSFTNESAGLTTGFGTIASSLANLGVFRVTGGQSLRMDGSLSNSGTLRVDDGVLQLNSATNPTNSGLIVVKDTGVLAGLTVLANTGRIEGGGQVNIAVANNAGGRIQPTGTLTLGRALTTAAGSQINLTPGSTLLATGGFASNAGLIAMSGGALDTGSGAITNASTGNITGWGILTTGGLRNSGTITLAGGTSILSGPVVNDAGRTLRVQSAVAIFTGAVTNNGNITVTSGDAIFTGGFSGGAPLGLPLSSSPNSLVGVGNTTLNANTFLEANGLAQNTLTVGTGARVLVTTREPDGMAVDGRFAPASTSVLDTISIAKDFGTGRYTGFVDLTTNDLVVRSPNRAAQVTELAAARDMVRGWYTSNGGLPGQVGLGTTAAFYNPLDAFVTLSVFDNDINGDGVGEMATFNGFAVLSTDVIVKYTYLGDTNIDGVVDATDLARVLQGLQGLGTGWNFGDVDHDGVVTSFDLGRTLAALRGQGASLGFGAGSGGGPIPEPSSLAGVVVAGALLGRRRR